MKVFLCRNVHAKQGSNKLNQNVLPIELGMIQRFREYNRYHKETKYSCTVAPNKIKWFTL